MINYDNPSLKILHLITGLNNGGAEASLFRLIENDPNNKHIVISMMDGGRYEELLQKLGITVHRLNMPRGKLTFNGLLKLWHLLKEDKPHIIQTWMYHADFIGGLFAKLQGSPCIWNIRHSNLSRKKTTFSTHIIVHVCAYLSHIIPSKIISCAQHSVKVHQLIGYSKTKFIAIPNGYKLEKFSECHTTLEQLQCELLLPRNITILGMVGRFDPQKDHQTLINALKIIKNKNADFLCLLAGKNLSVDNKELITWIEKAALHNNLLLLEQRNDIPAIMSLLDLHILSSAFGEAFPNVIAEAMAVGTPCVATNVGDTALIIADTGWVVPPSDSQALANAILAALEQKEQRPDAWQARKQAARQRIIDNFSVERMVAAYNEVWQGVIK